jgi:hypothetical protein
VAHGFSEDSAVTWSEIRPVINLQVRIKNVLARPFLTAAADGPARLRSDQRRAGRWSFFAALEEPFNSVRAVASKPRIPYLLRRWGQSVEQLRVAALSKPLGSEFCRLLGRLKAEATRQPID